jgi:hypothetical protein
VRGNIVAKEITADFKLASSPCPISGSSNTESHSSRVQFRSALAIKWKLAVRAGGKLRSCWRVRMAFAGRGRQLAGDRPGPRPQRPVTSPAAQTGDAARNGKVDPTAAALGEGAAIHCSYGSRYHAQSRDEAAGIADELTLLALFRAGAVLDVTVQFCSDFRPCRVQCWAMLKSPSHKKLDRTEGI